MNSGLTITLIILAVFLVAIVVLYFVGKKMKARQLNLKHLIMV